MTSVTLAPILCPPPTLVPAPRILLIPPWSSNDQKKDRFWNLNAQTRFYDCVAIGDLRWLHNWRIQWNVLSFMAGSDMSLRNVAQVIPRENAYRTFALWSTLRSSTELATYSTAIVFPRHVCVRWSNAVVVAWSWNGWSRASVASVKL